MTTALPRLALALIGLAACQAAFAQTYVGSLDGTSTASTFEVNSTTSLPTLGWTAVTGSPRVFDATNDAVINGNGLNHNPYTVQYVTSSNLVANSTYTLSFRMGYFSSSATGLGEYYFSLGTWTSSGGFNSLQSASGGPVSYGGLFSSDGNNGTTRTLTYTTGSSVSSDAIAVRWAQTSDTTGGADFFGFDNATLSYVSAIPEPSTYAALLGVGAIGFAAWRRRRGPAPARR